ncbi:hypothetical protein AAIG96_30515, partial [Pseudomonas aeruginosa]
PKKSRGTSRIVTDAITIQNPRNRGGSTGHVLAKRSVTFTEIRTSRTIPVISRHKDGRVFAHLLRMNRVEFEQSSIPNDCYIESAFQCRLRPVAC